MKLFNIVGFGSTYESIFEQSVPLDQDSFKFATTILSTWKPYLGGTEVNSFLLLWFDYFIH